MAITGLGQETYRAYYQALRSYREEQFRAGDMVGYQETTKSCEDLNNNVLKGQKDVSQILNIPQSGRLQIRQLEGNLESGILGLSILGDGSQMYSVTASYAEDSSRENPIIEVKANLLEENGAVQEVRVKVAVNQVEITAATQLEMFALCSHGDKQGLDGFAKTGDSYRRLLMQAGEEKGCMGAENLMEFIGKKQDWSQLERTTEEKINSLLEDRIAAENGVPYYHLAKDGIIDYKGVIFVCDEEHKAICLGNVADKGNCLTIPLSEGGCLIVNRDNLGDLAKAISMFSPEDVNLIMRAIAQDAKVQQMKNELEDDSDVMNMSDQDGDTQTAEIQMADSVAEESMINEK